MEFKKLKELAAQLEGVGKHRIWVDSSASDRVKESLTKEDVRQLMKDGIVKKKRVQGTSRGRAKKLLEKKQKGRRKGYGKRTGSFKARSDPEAQWVNRVRSLRKKLRELKSEKKIKNQNYRSMYKKIKGNFFKGKKSLEQFATGEQS